MLTPRFTATQDADAVTLVVRVPHVRVGAAEVSVVDGDRVSFWCKPFLLQLRLPGAVVDDDRVRAVYDPDDAGGTVTITLPKATPGAHFPDLDLAARLLAPRAAPPVSRLAGGGGGGGGVVDLSHIVRVAGEGDDDDDATGVAGLGARMEALSAAGVSRARLPPPPSSQRAGPPLIEVVDERPADASGARGGDAAAGAGRGGGGGGGGGLRDVAGSVDDDDDDAGPTPAAAATHGGGGGAAAAQPAGGPGATRLRLASAASPPRYGFNRRFARFFARGLRAEFPSVLRGLPDPDGTPEALRATFRVGAEEADWDGGWRVAGDCAADGGGADDALAAAADPPPGVVWWRGGGAGDAGLSSLTLTLTLSESEADEAAVLPRRELLVDGVIVGGWGSSAAGAAASGRVAEQPVAPGPASASASTSAFNIRLADAVDLTARPEAGRLLLGLVPLLAAVAYDARVTGGEPTVESGWTIATLSPLLAGADDDAAPPLPSDDAVVAAAAAVRAARVRRAARGPMPDADAEAEGLDTAAEEGDVSADMAAVSRRRLAPSAATPAAGAGAVAARPHVDPDASASAAVRASAASFVRRALLYPYLRRWDLAAACLRDAGDIMAATGSRGVLRALLTARRALASGGDGLYLLNTLFLDNYAAWVARGGVSDAALAVVGRAVAQLAGDGRLRVGAAAFEPGHGGAGGAASGALRPDDPEFGAWRLLERAAGVPPDDEDEGEGEGDEVGSEDDGDDEGREEGEDGGDEGRDAEP